MKLHKAKFTVIMFMLLLLCHGAYAEGSYEEAKTAIYNALVNCEDSVDVSAYNIVSKADINSIRDQIMNTYMELYFFNGYISFSKSNGVVTNLNLSNSYEDNKSNIKNKLKIYNAFKREALSKITDDMTDFEKIAVIHDYIATHLEYDTDYNIFNCVEMVVEGKGVCEGYSQLFYDLCKEENIECGFATSDEISHKWNVVKLNDNWYHLDVTYDDPIDDIYAGVQHTYMLVSEDKLLELDPDRDDLVYSEECDCSDTSFDEAPWRSDTNSSIIPYENKLYYISGTELIQHDNDTCTDVTITSFPAYTQFAMAGIGIDGGYLYHTNYEIIGTNDNGYIWDSFVYKINLSDTSDFEEIYSMSGEEFLQSLMVEDGVLTCGVGEFNGSIEKGFTAKVGTSENFNPVMGIVDGSLYVLGHNSLTDSVNLFFSGDDIQIDKNSFSLGFNRLIKEIPENAEKAFIWTDNLKPLCEKFDIQ